MGATDFHNVVKADTAEEAYRIIVDDARSEFGSDPYNGTISTTHGFRMVSAPKSGAINSEKHYEMVLDLAEKRGNCCCWKDPKQPKLWHFAGWAAE